MPLLIENAVRSELREVGKKYPQRRRMLLFLCSSCGTEMWVENDPKLLARRTGECRTCICSRFNPRKRPFEWLYNQLVYNAKYWGYSLSLTFEEFQEFVSIPECHYCGEPIVWNEYSSDSCSRAINLDRKDSQLGYEKSNLVVACVICNRIKNSYLSYEEMLLLSPVLRQIRIARKK